MTPAIKAPLLPNQEPSSSSENEKHGSFAGSCLLPRVVESERQLSLALEAFPVDLQEQLNQYMDKRMDGEALKSYVSHWPAQRWQEYEPLLTYCRELNSLLVAFLSR
ncbi:unnamed protein product [Brassica oleracea var. botrytis]|uniref:(rape) hypothetical protein n=1 Tax=Brassica napus TaxID=3708 RepID=A0A816K791_BRANA|nr:unnamed protein product [Brassica napus]